jgi:hypothetical protein
LDQDQRVPSPTNSEDVNSKIEAQQTLGNLMGELLQTAKPTGSRISQKWLDQDQLQREASNRLWTQMRSRHRQTLERLKIGEDAIQEDLKILPADLSAEHISDIQKEHAELLVKIAEKECQKAAKKAVSKSEIQTQWGSDAQEGASSTREPKVKVKTRSDKPVEESLETSKFQIKRMTSHPSSKSP